VILPTKYVPPARSLLGVGALLLRHLRRERTVASLWDAVRTEPEVVTLERFALALDLLYATGAVSLHEGLLRRGMVGDPGGSREGLESPGMAGRQRPGSPEAA
jgi:hypothetical protein